jgi:hypothetical protein
VLDPVKGFVVGNLLKIVGVTLGVVFLFAIVQTVRIEGVWCKYSQDRPRCLVEGFKQQVQILRFDLRMETARADTEAAKHEATKLAYREAQEEAARIQAEVVAREVARQKEITNEVRRDYSRRIADLRARAERLRAQIRSQEDGGGASGSAYPVRVPIHAGTATRIDDPSACQRLPARDVDTDITCRQIATEQAIQLDALIEWVRRQVNKE